MLILELKLEQIYGRSLAIIEGGFRSGNPIKPALRNERIVSRRRSTGPDTGEEVLLELPAAFNVQRSLVGDDIRMRAVRTAGSNHGRAAPGAGERTSVLLSTARWRDGMKRFQARNAACRGMRLCWSIRLMAHFLVDHGLKQKKRCWISCGESGVGKKAD